jgi:ATP-dependent DNA helicase RecQ
VGTKTGSGKSLIYECIPAVLPDSAVIVLTPLLSIMKEQTERLCELGFRATYIWKDATEDEQILQGQYQFVFGSPESIVGDKKWTDMISVYGDRLKLVVVDEAHTVIQW